MNLSWDIDSVVMCIYVVTTHYDRYPSSYRKKNEQLPIITCARVDNDKAMSAAVVASDSLFKEMDRLCGFR